MTEDEAFDRIWAMGKPKSGNWQDSTFPVVKPTRKVLRKAFDNACKGWDLPELVNTIQLALQAQQKDRALSLKNRHSISQPVGFAVWLNQERWELEIESAAEKSERPARTCHCGNEWPCERHYYDTVKDDWRWNLINQKWRELWKPKTQTECIQALKDAGHLNLLLILKRPEGKRGKNLTKMGEI